MSLWRRYIRKALDLLLKSSAILVFKIVGPPRVLRYGSPVNVAILRAFGADIGDDVMIHSPVVLHSAVEGYAKLTISDDCLLNGYNYLDMSSSITLEKGVSLGPGVIIMTHNRYNGNAFLEERLAHTCGKGPVLIKEGAGIKAHALIVHGVTIGRNAVVAGGAVVNRDVADNCFVAGVPARLVKEIK
ncbi:MAG TPA: acyltransferase [Sedimentisphaerales bacterium]|nr:acyltransferase [Sedimentisphaerales bacterium]